MATKAHSHSNAWVGASLNDVAVMATLRKHCNFLFWLGGGRGETTLIKAWDRTYCVGHGSVLSAAAPSAGAALGTFSVSSSSSAGPPGDHQDDFMCDEGGMGVWRQR